MVIPRLRLWRIIMEDTNQSPEFPDGLKVWFRKDKCPWKKILSGRPKKVWCFLIVETTCYWPPQLCGATLLRLRTYLPGKPLMTHRRDYIALHFFQTKYLHSSQIIYQKYYLIKIKLFYLPLVSSNSCYVFVLILLRMVTFHSALHSALHRALHLLPLSTYSSAHRSGVRIRSRSCCIVNNHETYFYVTVKLWNCDIPNTNQGCVKCIKSCDLLFSTFLRDDFSSSCCNIVLFNRWTWMLYYLDYTTIILMFFSSNNIPSSFVKSPEFLQ